LKKKDQTNKSSSVHQPHDRLVKKLLSDPTTAHDILSLYLPKNVLDVVNLNNLELQRDSFIDDEHHAFAVDLLYKTTLQNEEGYIWILIEHQRKSDHWMPLRLFKYIAIIWDHLRATSKLTYLPLVYPLVLFNGNQAYIHSLNLMDLIEPAASKDIFKDMFTRPFCLIDLAAIQDETLRKQAQNQIKGVILLMALKHVFSKDLQDFLDQILITSLKQLDQAGGSHEVVDLLYFLLNEGKFLDKEQFLLTLRGKFSRAVEDKMMTVAQQLKEEGRIQEKIKIANNLLAEKTELSDTDLINWVHRMTGLSAEKIKELRKKH
jgi:recombination-promoting nuclease RpnB